MIKDLFSMTGKVCLVTGASSGWVVTWLRASWRPVLHVSLLQVVQKTTFQKSGRIVSLK